MEIFLQKDVLAFLVAAFIFLITLIAVVRERFGFFLSLLFLTFALTSGFFIANNDLVRVLLQGKKNQQSLLQAAVPNRKNLLQELPVTENNIAFLRSKLQEVYRSLEILVDDRILSKESIQDVLEEEQQNILRLLSKMDDDSNIE